MIKHRLSNNVVLLFLACVLVFAQRTEPPEPDEDVPELRDLLLDHDKKLCETYAQRRKGEGGTIMTLMREYTNALAKLVNQAYRQRKNNDTMTTLTEAKPLFDKGGPGFINFYSDRAELERDFGCNNVTSRIIGGQRQNAIDLWEDFYNLNRKLSDSDEDYDFISEMTPQLSDA